ncbi:hypothetical protein DFH11DRAFT_1545823 [Phellopilus nigrolimitatus]|nr:hypothetical protein DFH11DRAFT_1545823 [Phellopilus nigrolimitatus]
MAGIAERKEATYLQKLNKAEYTFSLSRLLLQLPVFFQVWPEGQEALHNHRITLLATQLAIEIRVGSARVIRGESGFTSLSSAGLNMNSRLQNPDIDSFQITCKRKNCDCSYPTRCIEMRIEVQCNRALQRLCAADACVPKLFIGAGLIIPLYPSGALVSLLAQQLEASSLLSSFAGTSQAHSTTGYLALVHSRNMTGPTYFAIVMPGKAYSSSTQTASRSHDWVQFSLIQRGQIQLLSIHVARCLLITRRYATGAARFFSSRGSGRRIVVSSVQVHPKDMPSSSSLARAAALDEERRRKAAVLATIAATAGVFALIAEDEDLADELLNSDDDDKEEEERRTLARLSPTQARPPAVAAMPERSGRPAPFPGSANAETQTLVAGHASGRAAQSTTTATVRMGRRTPVQTPAPAPGPTATRRRRPQPMSKGPTDSLWVRLRLSEGGYKPPLPSVLSALLYTSRRDHPTKPPAQNTDIAPALLCPSARCARGLGAQRARRPSSRTKPRISKRREDSASGVLSLAPEHATSPTPGQLALVALLLPNSSSDPRENAIHQLHQAPYGPRGPPTYLIAHPLPPMPPTAALPALPARRFQERLAAAPPTQNPPRAQRHAQTGHLRARRKNTEHT